ncbi:MAG: protein kinase, partial [Planctomycetota bacterium]|nr:protein kinase [Planctomycetota bacterium]
MLGQKIKDMTLEVELGKGMLGTTYQASLGQSSSIIKIFDNEEYYYLLKTAYGSKRVNLSAGGLCGFHQLGHSGDHYYLKTVELSGDSIGDFFQKEALLSLKRILDIIKGAATVLQQIHDRGVVHGGVKPGNVFIMKRGGVALSDCGHIEVLRRLNPKAFKEYVASSNGTGSSYLPPALRSGDTTPTKKSDVYGLGVLLYNMLLHAAERKEIPESHDFDRDKVTGTVPEKLAEIVLKATSDTPYKSASQFLQALNDIKVSEAKAEFLKMSGAATAAVAPQAGQPDNAPVEELSTFDVDLFGDDDEEDAPLIADKSALKPKKFNPSDDPFAMAGPGDLAPVDVKIPGAEQNTPAPKSGVDPFAPPSGADPFGADAGDPFAPGGATAAPASDPFAPPSSGAAPANDPFAPSASDPFAAPSSGSNQPADPFAAPEASAAVSDPFAAPSSGAAAPVDPFAAPSSGAAPANDPFAPSANDPFAAPSSGAAPANDPFAPPSAGAPADPFASSPAPGNDPFASSPAPGNDPFAANPAPAANDPFAPSAADPFAAPSPAPADPFAAPASGNNQPADPFAAPASGNNQPADPFAATTTGEDPFAQGGPPPSDPFANPGAANDPFASPGGAPNDPFANPGPAPANDPFASPNAGAMNDPFASNPAPGNDPFAANPAPGSDPFSSTAPNDPFAAPGAPPAANPFPSPQANDPFAAPGGA